MSIEVKSLFISSTSDLVEEREATWEVIRQYQMEREVLPYISDHDLRPGGTPQNRILKEIRNADLFLMILGGRYGSPYREAKEQPPPSICEWEFRMAGKNHIPLFSLEKVVPDESIEEPQRRFRNRVREFRHGSWTQSFSTREEFSRTLSAALMAWRRADSKVGRGLEYFTYGMLAASGIYSAALLWIADHVSRYPAKWLTLMATIVFAGFSIHIFIRTFRK